MLSLGEEHKASVRSLSWRERLRAREQEDWEALRTLGGQPRHHLSQNVTYILEDALQLLARLPLNSLSAIVTDPPYGIEYEEKDHTKLRAGRGGVWRIPPSFDGASRKPLPRFTVLSDDDHKKLHCFFVEFGVRALRALAPGGHVFIASNPLLSSMTFHSLQEAGFEKRGEIIRLVQTLRGGYKPKGAESDFPEVSVMPRACWEPWGIFRKPFDGTVAHMGYRRSAQGRREGTSQRRHPVLANARS